MIHRVRPGLFVTALLLLPFAAMAQTAPDSVSVTSQGDCCFSFMLKNRNSSQRLIQEFDIIAQTAGIEIRIGATTPSAPKGWQVLSASPDTVRFVPATGSIGLRAGQSLDGFIVCFNNSVSSFSVKWNTKGDGAPISSGTINLTCPLQTDLVTPSPRGNCCFEWSVVNQNSAHSIINDFHVTAITPGVTLTSVTPPTGWSVTGGGAGSSSVSFTAGANYIIPVGGNATGFATCFQLPPTGIGTYLVQWETTLGGKVVSTDTVTLQCTPVQPTCDSVGARLGDNCCYDFYIYNHNSQKRPTSDFHIKILTPGVTVRPTPTSPTGWNVSVPSSTEVNYVAQSGAYMISPGGFLNGFGVCFDFAGGLAIPFQVQCQTTMDGAVVCTDTVSLQCTLTTSCDSVEVKASPLAACCYEMVLKNRHTPNGPLNDFHLKIVSGNATFQAGSVSGAWPPTINTGTDVTWSIASTVLPSGADQGGFQFCLSRIAGTSGTITAIWYSTLNGTPVCQDTVTFDCQELSSCDSIRTKPMDNCCYEFELLNRHSPPGPLTDFHIGVLTTGVVIRAGATTPTNWSVSSQTATTVDFKEITGAGLPSGGNQGNFVVCFDNVPAPGVVKLLWCSTYNDKAVCCDTVYVQCAPSQTTCDSVRVKPLDKCCFDLTLLNAHLPTGALTDFHVDVMTPGVTIRPTPFAPGGGWKVTGLTGVSVDFADTTGAGLPGGSSLSGFVVCFDNVPASGIVQFRWYSTIKGARICVDSTRVQCQPGSNQCDEVTPVLIDSSKCCWDFKVANLHTPVSVVNDFHIRILTPNVSVTSVNKPIGWGVTNTTSAVDWTIGTGTPIPSNSSLTGFVVCIDAKDMQGKPFQVEWRTTINQQTICIDTISLACPSSTGIEQLPGPMPSEFHLYQNFPNPFNPTTSITFDVPHDSFVELEVFDATGRTSVTLVKDQLGAGKYQVLFDASTLSSGTYFYRLRTREGVLTRSMVLLK